MPAIALRPPQPFADLNDQQREAVEHGMGEPGLLGSPLLVIAGAGSGKTMTLASRAARLVLAGADPQRILMLTFSRRAAKEMSNRAGRLLHEALGYASTQQPPALRWAGTFHGIAARLLRDYATAIGLSESFTILDRGDAEDMMGSVRHELGLDRVEGRHRFPMKGTCLAIYSRAINSQAALLDLLPVHYPWCIERGDDLRRLFTAYEEEKRRQAVLDFDDLLQYLAQMMTHPTIAQDVRARFDHVLVDEYQDTNRLQARVLMGLKPDGRGLTVVGDDAQSIYSFRAAEVRNILDFPNSFEARARVVALERNYRSTQPILDASNAVIALATERFCKALWTDRASSQRPEIVTVEDDAAQARWVADRVLKHREEGLQLKAQAVLFRTSHHSTALELELTRRNIPFVKFGGLQFLEASHVKDVLSVLRWADNPRNRQAGLRVLQLVPGVGATTACRLLDAMEASSDPVGCRKAFSPPKAATIGWEAFSQLFDHLTSAAARWPDDLALANSWYAPHLERLYEDARVRAADLVQLERIAQGFADRRRFLAELALDPPSATSGEAAGGGHDEDYLILSTIHSAKGQEWQSVHLLNAVDGCIPSDLGTGSHADLEEERRLLYVALTRARNHLQVISPQRFYVSQQAAHGDRHVYGQLTRFIPDSVAEHFDMVSASAAPTQISRALPAGLFDITKIEFRPRW